MLIADMVVREGTTGDLDYGDSAEETLRWVRQYKQNLIWIANDMDLFISVRCARTWICTVYPSGTLHFNQDLVTDNWDYSLNHES